MTADPAPWFEAFADELADASGAAILPWFRTALVADDKSGGRDFDPVTAADRAAEAAMRALIGERFPSHGILGEEEGAVRPDAEVVWVLDPIDGTKSFIGGMPGWGTLIGLTHGGVPTHGMMHQPFTRERFWGDTRAARYRGPSGERPLRVRACAGLHEAALYTTSPRLIDRGGRPRFHALEERVRLSRYGGDCYAYCMLAMGLVDLVVEAGLQPYDIVALIPVIQGAGGIVTTWEGGPAGGGGRIVAAGDARVHAAALEMLNAA